MNTFKTKPLTKIQVFSILLSSIFISNLSALPFVTTLDDCNSLYKSQKYREYIDSCADYAKEDLATKWNFSQIYALGAAGLKNPQLAAFYAEDPAKAGVVEAISALCDDYMHGSGVKQDYERSFWWCSKGANQDDYYSMLSLAYLYEYGLGTARNSNKAISLYYKLATNDNKYTVVAQYDLSRVYLNLGPPNYSDGLYWLKKAYLQKNPDAITQIEIMQNKMTQCDFKKIYFDSDLSYADAVDTCDGRNLTTTKGISSAKAPLTNQTQTVEQMNSLAEQYYANYDYQSALYWYQKAADQGSPIAQLKIGFMYQHHLGVAKSKHISLISITSYESAKDADYIKAVYWYQKSAYQGNADAQSSLGFMYQHGYGVANDSQKAFYWYQKAADQGDANAQNALANVFNKAGNYKNAFYWYQKSAYQGNSDAQSSLGNMYLHGMGITKDESKAVYWYQKAADHEFGAQEDQYTLGYMYENGVGVAKNITKAVYWYQKAADQGNANAIEDLKSLR